MILWKIVLPMSRPIIGVVSIFALVAVWKDFLWPLLVEYGYTPTRETLNVGIWQPCDRHAAEPAHRRVRHGRGADDRVLPDLPAQHHGRPHRGRHQGLTLLASRPSRRPRPSGPAPRPSRPGATAAAAACRVSRDHEKAGSPCTCRPPPAPSGPRPDSRRRPARRPGSTRGGASAAIYQLYVRSFADGNGDGIGDLAGRRGRSCPTWRTSASTPSGSTPGTRRRWPTPGTTSPTTGHRPGLRHPGRGGRADRRGARARHPDHHRHRAQPLLRPAPVVHRGRAGRRAGLRGARPVLVPARPRPGRRAAAEQLAVQLRRAGLDPGHRAGRLTRRVVPAPVRARAAGLQLGPADVRREFEDILRFWFDRGVDGIRIDSAALLVKDPPCRTSPATSRPARRTRTPTATRCTTSTSRGGPSLTQECRRPAVRDRLRTTRGQRSGC